MRTSFLPILVFALSVLSPIAAQDPSEEPSAAPSPTDSAGGTDVTDGGNAGDAGNSGDNSGDSGDNTSGDAPSDGDTQGGNAPIAPSEPSPETSVKIGGDLNVMWDMNSDSSEQWTNMTIELMTGSNFNMQSLTVVGKNINAMTGTVYSFKVPAVHPTSQIYFLQFTNPGYAEKLWTTRFTITGTDGSSTPPAQNTTDTNGENPVFWGVGALGSGSNNGTSAPAPTAPAQAGVGANGVTLYTQGINTGTQVPPGVTLTGVAAATLGAKGPVGGSGASRGSVVAPASVVGALIAAAAFFA